MKFPSWPSMTGYRDINFGLERVYNLLQRLDNPHLKLPPTIHIAGTNGKGSTLAFLQAIFEEKGLLVHKYTSPHLVDFNERIILAGSEISDDFLNEILIECKIASEIEPKIPVTFFEGITVAAFLAFSKIDADVLLLETGMGGRFDATNILENVLCSIITPISFDHQDFLGESLEEIAFEKAGIIKKGCPVIISKQESEALEVLEKKAKESLSKTIIFNKDYRIDIQENRFGYISKKSSMKLNFPNLIGTHQIENAALAVAAALESALVALSPDEISLAISKAKWPARLQKINSGRFFDKIPKNSQLFLDGSHNLQGAKTIADFLDANSDKKITIIFAMLNDKDCEGFLKEIANKINKIIVMEIPNEKKSLKTSQILEISNKLSIKNISLADDFEDAFLKLSKEGDELILICGSLYLAGAFLEENYTKVHL